MKVEDIMARFMSLHDESIEDKEMHTADAIFKMAMSELAEHCIEAAQKVVDSYDGMLHYNNYLTEQEARDVVYRLENTTEGGGIKWDNPDDFVARTRALGIECERAPYYNRWAMYAVANMMSSDHYSVICKLCGNDRNRYMEICASLAASQLMDRDKPEWIRWYVGLE